MSVIYKPKGRAGEYAGLAVNLYEGCDNGCFYCYVPRLKARFNSGYNHREVRPRENIIERLKKDAVKYRNSQEYVLLCFTCDPYCAANEEHQLTRQALQIFYENKIPVKILTKNSIAVLYDYDIIKKFGGAIEIGASLTFDNADDSLKYEPMASIPQYRLEMLRALSWEKKIKTWASIEPVIYEDQSFNLIKESRDFIDTYYIGGLNYFPGRFPEINYRRFYDRVTRILERHKCTVIFKDDFLKKLS